MLEASYWELIEDYLGVAPIQPGRHRYRHNEVVLLLYPTADPVNTVFIKYNYRQWIVVKQQGWNREKLYISSLSV